MFHPLSLFVGLRYVRARSHKFFVSFITWTSLAGVCVGVAALIVILSVMNGFEGDLRQRLLSLDADARVVATDVQGAATPNSEQWQAAAKAIRGSPGVTGVAPYAEIQALAVRTPEMLSVQLRVPLTMLAVVLALVVTGWTSAALGDADRPRAIRRNVIGGVLAMGVTYGIGSLVGLGV